MTDPIVETPLKPPPEPEIPEPSNDVVEEPAGPETNPEAETESGVEPA